MCIIQTNNGKPEDFIIINLSKIMKIRTMMTAGLILSVSFLFLLGGCSHLYEIDFAAQRQTHLSEDLASLQFEKHQTLPDPMTLDDAVAIGLQNNLDMRVSEMMAAIENDNALSEKLKMLPTLEADGTYSKSNVYNAPDEDLSNKRATLSFAWNLLDFGLSYIRARQAALRTEVRKIERMRQAQNLALDIVVAYWKAVLAEQSLEKIRKIEAEVNDYRIKAEELVKQKRLDPIASKAIEKKIVELAITASNLQADISGAKIELSKLMGLGPATSFNLMRASFKAYVEKLPSPLSLDSLKLEKIALRGRPEFFSADIDMNIQQDEAKAALISMFPGIEFDFALYYNTNSYNVNNFWSTWGGSITSSLLSLPFQYVNWKKQKKTLEMMRLQRLILTAGVIVQTHIAVHDYVVKERQFRLYDDAFVIAEDLLKMSRERHQLGLLSDWAMTQRMLEDVVAMLERDRRIIDVINAYNILLVTLGRDYNRWKDALSDISETDIKENPASPVKEKQVIEKKAVQSPKSPPPDTVPEENTDKAPGGADDYPLDYPEELRDTG